MGLLHLWTCGTYGLVGLVRHLGLEGFVDLSICGLVDLWELRELWTCGSCGHVGLVDVLTCGIVGLVGLVDMWTCGTCGILGLVGLRIVDLLILDL